MLFSLGEVEALLAEGVTRGAFPGAVAAWGDPLAGSPALAAAGRRGRSRNLDPVEPGLVYDLASLSKILVSTSLAMIFFQQGRLDLTLPLDQGPLTRLRPSKLSPAADWSQINPAHLLSHQSGLPPWRPFYRLGGESIAVRRQKVFQAIWEETPQARPGEATVYSDLNFILLGRLLEEIGGAPLDRLFAELVAGPLGISASFKPAQSHLAPTEDGFRFGGPVGHPEALRRGPVPLGRVHDDNAAWLGGVSGHAGLFASAPDLWTLAADWAAALAGGPAKIFDRRSLETFLRPRPARRDAGRPLGFNIKREVAALAGSRFSEKTVGHLGYTGGSLWWDLKENFLWIFLSNRVHPRAWNPAWIAADFVGGPKMRLRGQG